MRGESMPAIDMRYLQINSHALLEKQTLFSRAQAGLAWAKKAAARHMPDLPKLERSHLKKWGFSFLEYLKEKIIDIKEYLETVINPLKKDMRLYFCNQPVLKLLHAQEQRKKSFGSDVLFDDSCIPHMPSDSQKFFMDFFTAKNRKAFLLSQKSHQSPIVVLVDVPLLNFICTQDNWKKKIEESNILLIGDLKTSRFLLNTKEIHRNILALNFDTDHVLPIPENRKLKNTELYFHQSLIKPDIYCPVPSDYCFFLMNSALKLGGSRARGLHFSHVRFTDAVAQEASRFFKNKLPFLSKVVIDSMDLYEKDYEYNSTKLFFSILSEAAPNLKSLFLPFFNVYAQSTFIFDIFGKSNLQLLQLHRMPSEAFAQITSSRFKKLKVLDTAIDYFNRDISDRIYDQDTVVTVIENREGAIIKTELDHGNEVMLRFLKAKTNTGLLLKARSTFFVLPTLPSSSFIEALIPFYEKEKSFTSFGFAMQTLPGDLSLSKFLNRVKHIESLTIKHCKLSAYSEIFIDPTVLIALKNHPSLKSLCITFSGHAPTNWRSFFSELCDHLPKNLSDLEIKSIYPQSLKKDFEVWRKKSLAEPNQPLLDFTDVLCAHDPMNFCQKIQSFEKMHNFIRDTFYQKVNYSKINFRLKFKLRDTY
jgi:hypothetical protein